MYFVVKLYFILLRILLCVVEIREACLPILFSIRNIIDKSLCIECKLCPSSCVSMCWIIHFVKLVAVVVISIHSDNQCLDIVLCFKCLFDLLAKIAFSRSPCASDTNEWNNVILRFAKNLYNIICNFVRY